MAVGGGDKPLIKLASSNKGWAVVRRLTFNCGNALAEVVCIRLTESEANHEKDKLSDRTKLLMSSDLISHNQNHGKAGRALEDVMGLDGMSIFVVPLELSERTVKVAQKIPGK